MSTRTPSPGFSLLSEAPPWGRAALSPKRASTKTIPPPRVFISAVSVEASSVSVMPVRSSLNAFSSALSAIVQAFLIQSTSCGVLTMRM